MKEWSLFSGETARDGPGEYVPDVTEGITRVEDLPVAKIVRRSRNTKKCRCPDCEYPAYRDRVFTRTLHDLGDLAANRPVDIAVTYSQHCCSKLGTYFNADLTDLADHRSQYSRRVVPLAVPVVVWDGLA